jgi:hypothetical protein
MLGVGLSVMSKGFHTAGATIDACQVLARLDFLKPGLAQQVLHGLRLVPAMLQQQPPTRCEAAGGLGDDLTDVVQAIGPAGEGLQGFVGQGGQVGIAIGHIRRI